MSTSSAPSSDQHPASELSTQEKVLGAIGGVQALTMGITRQATTYAAQRLPEVPGFPSDVLEGPTAVVDKVFESVEDALAPRSPLARDVVHQQGTFVRGMFASVQPIVDALSGRDDDRGPATRR